jgi:hypothetical protein
MDECLAPGIFWPYGNPVIKTQLTYLTWNMNCTHLLTRQLGEDCSDEKRLETTKKLVLARELVEKQSDTIISAMQ